MDDGFFWYMNKLKEEEEEKTRREAERQRLQEQEDNWDELQKIRADVEAVFLQEQEDNWHELQKIKKASTGRRDSRKKNKYDYDLELSCPKCGGDLKVIKGKWATFLGCENYPDCEYTFSGKTEHCPKCGKRLKVRTGKHGPFLGCAGFPECKYIKIITMKVIDKPRTYYCRPLSYYECIDGLSYESKGNEKTALEEKKSGFQERLKSLENEYSQLNSYDDTEEKEEHRRLCEVVRDAQEAHQKLENAYISDQGHEEIAYCIDEIKRIKGKLLRLHFFEYKKKAAAEEELRKLNNKKELLEKELAELHSLVDETLMQYMDAEKEEQVFCEELKEKEGQRKERKSKLMKEMSSLKAELSFAQEIERVTRYNVGDIIAFGNIKHGSKNKPIEWVVLKDLPKGKLLITKKAIAIQPFYNLSWNPDGEKEYLDPWETSDLRKFLNEEFYKKSFSTSERKLIAPTKVPTLDLYNSIVSNRAVYRETKDNVFCLSMDECNSLFSDKASRLCEPVDVKKVKKLISTKNEDEISINYPYNMYGPELMKALYNIEDPENNPYCCWWLRTPGPLFGDFSEESDGRDINDKIVDVAKEGFWGIIKSSEGLMAGICMRVGVDCVGDYHNGFPAMFPIGVRPAIVLKTGIE